MTIYVWRLPDTSDIVIVAPTVDDARDYALYTDDISVAEYDVITEHEPDMTKTHTRHLRGRVDRKDVI